jgi:hypothetical protein
MAQVVTVLNDADFNGECFIYGSEGEREEVLLHRVVAFPDAIPVGIVSGTPFAVNNAEKQAYMRSFYNLQVVRLTANPGSATADEIRRIAYLRMLAFRNGLYDWGATAASKNVRYREYEMGVDVSALQDQTVPDAAWRAAVVPKFFNMVCIVAYFFRVRGHHWIAEMDDRYTEVWRKCLTNEDNAGIRWELVAHHVIHATFPVDLDAFWGDCVQNRIIAGTLIKRYTSYAAGVAGIAALNAGVNDIRMVMPKAIDVAKEAVEYLDQITAEITNHRWNGSINHNYYGANGVVVDEQKLGALGALIIAALQQFKPDAPLLRSNALVRVANHAPITGAVVATMMATAVKSERAALALLPDIS